MSLSKLTVAGGESACTVRTINSEMNATASHDRRDVSTARTLHFQLASCILRQASTRGIPGGVVERLAYRINPPADLSLHAFPKERLRKVADCMKIATTPGLWFSGQGRRSRSDAGGLSQRDHGHAMERAPETAPAAGGYRTASAGSAAGAQRHPVRVPHRLSVATASQRVCQVEKRRLGVLAPGLWSS